MKTLKMFVMVAVLIGTMVVSGCGTYHWSSPLQRTWPVAKMDDQVNITTRPSGCEIYVNDVHVGVSPLAYKMNLTQCGVVLMQKGSKNRRVYADPLRHGMDVVPPSTFFEKTLYPTMKRSAVFEIKIFKDGYRNGSKVINFNMNDAGFKSYVKSAEVAISGDKLDFSRVKFPPRNVFVALDPIPGHATTTPWRDTGFLEHGKRISFGLTDLKIIPTGAHTAKVSGKVSDATVWASVEQAHEKVYTDGSGQQRETKNVRRKISYNPKSVRIKNPFGPSPVLKVSEDGSFAGVLQSNSDIFFVKPKDRSYRIVKKLSGSSVYVYDSEDKGFVRSDDYPLPDMYGVELDYDAAHKYASGLVCNVTLEMKDKVTRRDVMPDVTITAVVAPTPEGIGNKFLKEFGQDDLGKILSDDAIKYLTKMGFLMKGQRMRKDAQSVSFAAYVGGEYRVETIHGEYYYFKGYIKPKSTSPISNTVLLVETGKKVRNQEVKESEGGSMVGSD